MQPGSLVVLRSPLTPIDIQELQKAGYPIPRVGRDIYEVKDGPYLTSSIDGRSILVVRLIETGITEWASSLLVEIDEPCTIDLESLVSKEK